MKAKVDITEHKTTSMLIDCKFKVESMQKCAIKIAGIENAIGIFISEHAKGENDEGQLKILESILQISVYFWKYIQITCMQWRLWKCVLEIER